MQTENWHLLQMRKSKRIGWYVCCFNAGGSDSTNRRMHEWASSVSNAISACTYKCVELVMPFTQTVQWFSFLHQTLIHLIHILTWQVLHIRGLGVHL